MSRHSRSLLSGNPVFSRASGCPITNFGHDKIKNGRLNTDTNQLKTKKHPVGTYWRQGVSVLSVWRQY